MVWLGMWFVISNTCDCMRSNGVSRNRETDEKHDEGCVKEGFQLARVKLDRNGEGGREALSMGNGSINI